jgi:hypothetical protein
MKYISDHLSIVPLCIFQDTAAVNSEKVRVDRGGGGDFSVLCQAAFYTTAAISLAGTTAADQSASKAANVVGFTVYEATAASHAGSAITGATLSLGPATANVVRGGVISVVHITSGLTTAETLTINGRDYHSDTTGPGRDGTAVATEVAAILNGRGTNEPILHYEAIANDLSSGLISIRPADDLATGVTLSNTAAAFYRVLPGLCQGVINIQMSKLSSNTPKYIGVAITETTGVVSKAVSLCRFPTGGGAFPGAVVNLTG